MGPGWIRTGTGATGFTSSKDQTALNPRFFGRFHKFANSELWLQLSIWVLIISQYDIYLKDVVLHALSLPTLYFAIISIFVELLWNNTNNWAFFAVTQRILTGSQNGDQEVKEYATLHLVHIYHIVIRSELRYLMGAKVCSSRQWGPAIWRTHPTNCRFMSGPGNKPARTQHVVYLGGSGTNLVHCSGPNLDRCQHLPYQLLNMTYHSSILTG